MCAVHVINNVYTEQMYGAHAIGCYNVENIGGETENYIELHLLN